MFYSIFFPLCNGNGIDVESVLDNARTLRSAILGNHRDIHKFFLTEALCVPVSSRSMTEVTESRQIRDTIDCSLLTPRPSEERWVRGFTLVLKGNS